MTFPCRLKQVTTYRFVKVFGERGSGTNFLHQLIAKNFDVKVIANISGPTPDERELIDAIPENRRRPGLIAERLADAHHLDQMPRNAGWKHACLTDRMFQTYGRAEKTLFLCIVRHPALWLTSFATNPYHGFNTKAQDLDEFIATPWVTRARDEVADVFLKSPALLWKLKVQSYLEHADRRENVLILRHEDLLLDHGAVLDELTPLLPRSAADWTLPEDYARRWVDKVRDFWSIQKALPDQPFDTISPGQAQHLRDVIGDELIERAGYELL